jgi:hypothetical protein
LGHSWRDLDPVGAAEQDARHALIFRLRELVRNKKLGEFEVEDLATLIKLFENASDLDVNKLQKFENKLLKEVDMT